MDKNMGLNLGKSPVENTAAQPTPVVSSVESVNDNNTASVAVNPLAPSEADKAATAAHYARNKRRIAIIMPTIGLMLISLLICLFLVHQRSGITTALNNVQAQTAAVQNQLEVAKSAASNNGIVINKAATGYDAARKEIDDKQIAELFSKFVAFDSADAYSKAREGLINDYGLDENGQFLSVFMPAANEQITDAIKNGNLAIAYKSMTSIPTAISGDNYSYAAFVTMGANREGGSASKQVLVQYTIDGNGKISDLTAYPLA